MYRRRQQFDREREVAHQGPDHCQLLVVLEPESGHVRLHLVEQPRHHGGDAVEMSGTMRTVEHVGDAGYAHAHGVLRSEEHTSELQSLMRISYAVFCLKKKPQEPHNNIQEQIQTPEISSTLFVTQPEQ